MTRKKVEMYPDCTVCGKMNLRGCAPAMYPLVQVPGITDICDQCRTKNWWDTQLEEMSIGAYCALLAAEKLGIYSEELKTAVEEEIADWMIRDMKNIKL